jgi:hypothetical protein
MQLIEFPDRSHLHFRKIDHDDFTRMKQRPDAHLPPRIGAADVECLATRNERLKGKVLQPQQGLLELPEALFPRYRCDPLGIREKDPDDQHHHGLKAPGNDVEDPRVDETRLVVAIRQGEDVADGGKILAHEALQRRCHAPLAEWPQQDDTQSPTANEEREIHSDNQ